MGNSVPAIFRRSIFTLGALLAAGTLHAQAQNPGRNINLIAANSTDHQIYSVTFTPPGGSTTVGNTDENNFVRPQSLTFVTNVATDQLDLLVADNQRGTIRRYAGAFQPQTPPNPTTSSVVFDISVTPQGPAAPVAMAVDGFGNLFVANSTSGHSQTAQLWEFPVGAAGSGSFAAPVLLDQNFQNKETLLEVAIVPTDVTGASGVAGGDLIVLTTSRVLAYSQLSGYTTHITLLSFPNGAPVLGGMDFWPIGNGTTANYSLLIGTSLSGTISRYYFTNPLTPAPAPFVTGLGTPYRIKTLFQAGTPLVFVSENGAILEFGASATGSGALLATVTQNVTSPQGMAVSNSFTNAASVCLQPGGCDLTGLVTHTVTNVASLTGNIVENVCTVNADPRVSFSSGVWACSVPFTPPPGFTCPPGTPTNGPGCLPVNLVCPGFDDTGTMAIPDSICGRSGPTGAGFSLLRTLAHHDQFAGGYVENSAVLADGSEPLCGPASGADGAFLWAPLKAEGNMVESPNMLDITSGCGSVHGGGVGLSVWAVGLSLNEGAPELTSGGLPRPLENYGQTKYVNLTNTIDGLTLADPSQPQWTGTAANIAAAVSLELWGGNVPGTPTGANAFGCLDQSWLDYFNATAVDADGSMQWTADLQNAANLLTNADTTGSTTCDSIVTTALANSQTAFVQTNAPNGPIELNPSGQVRSRLANLYYTINTRILGNAASAHWPLPVSVNVVPTSVTLATLASQGSATLSWNTNGASGCTLTSSDGVYANAALNASQVQLTIPPVDAGSLVHYTVSCSGGPAANSVSAYVNVYPPPTISVSPATIAQGSSATLQWNPNHALGCAAGSNDATPADSFTGTKSTAGSMTLTPANSGSFSYSLSCTTPNTMVATNLTVVAAPSVSLSAASVVQGTPATLSWNANGNTGCSWSSSDPGFHSPAGTSGSTSVNPTSSGSYTYTYACTSPLASSQSATLTVVQNPTASVSPASVSLGTGAKLSWNTNGNSSCTWSSTDPGFAAPAANSGNQTVKPTSAGTFTYTLTCPAPTVPAVATLTVNAILPPAISVSPNSITLGGSAKLAWTINPGDACTASSSGTDTNAQDAFTGMKGVSGSMTVTPNKTGTDTYTLTCTVPAGVVQSATLTVNPSLANIAISVTGSDIDSIGDRGTLVWTVNNGVGCQVSGQWPPYSSPQFSPFPVSSSGSKSIKFTAAGTYTYTLSCTNVATPVHTSVVISSYER